MDLSSILLRCDGSAIASVLQPLANSRVSRLAAVLLPFAIAAVIQLVQRPFGSSGYTRQQPQRRRARQEVRTFKLQQVTSLPMVTTRRTVHATPPSPEAAFTTPPKAPKRTPDSFDSQEHRNAFAYVMVVKNATSHDTCRAFLEALHTYQKNGREDLAGLVRRVADLFRDHADLLRDFEHFLPFDEEDRDGAAKEALRGAVAAAEESAVGRSGKKKRRRR